MIRLFYRSIFLNLVDFYLWLGVVAVFIKLLLGELDPHWIAPIMCALFIFYGFWVIIRLGKLQENVNEYVKEELDRHALNLYTYHYRNKAYNVDLATYLWTGFFVTGYVAFIIF